MEKIFSRFDFIFNILPGSLFLFVMFYFFKYDLSDKSIVGLSFFLIVAYLVGAFLQIIATFPIIRSLFAIGCSLNFNKESWIFLLKGNPILKPNYIEDLKKSYKVYFKQGINFDFEEKFDKYKYYGKTEIKNQSQYVFNKIYNVVRNEDMVKASNEQYLFFRSCSLALLLLGIISLFINIKIIYSLLIIFVGLLFLYRTLRIADGFIKQIVLHFNNFKKGK